MKSVSNTLSQLSFEELKKIYVLSADSDNKSSKELIDIVKAEHDFIYGSSDISFLDKYQLESLHNEIGNVILKKIYFDFSLGEGKIIENKDLGLWKYDKILSTVKETFEIQSDEPMDDADIAIFIETAHPSFYEEKLVQVDCLLNGYSFNKKPEKTKKLLVEVTVHLAEND